MPQAVLLDVFGTIVQDNGRWAADAVARVAREAGADPAVVAREWDARLGAMAGTAHGAAFRTLAAQPRPACLTRIDGRQSAFDLFLFASGNDSQGPRLACRRPAVE